MRTRRSLFAAGALVARRTRPAAGLMQGQEKLDLRDPQLAGLRRAKASEKTPLLQDLVEELVHRQTMEKSWKPLSRSPSDSGRKAPRGGSAGRPGSPRSSVLSPS